MFWLSAKVVICNMDTKSKKKKKEGVLSYESSVKVLVSI